MLLAGQGRRLELRHEFISHNVFSTSFFRSQFQHKSVDWVFILGGFESRNFSIKPKFRTTITPKLFTQLFEFEFRTQTFLEQIKFFHVGRVSG